jgi:hypothetical protein
MARARMDDLVTDGLTARRYLKLQADAQTLGAAVTIANESGVINAYDCGGSSRVVTLPTRAATNDGVVRLFINLSTAGETLTIKNAAATTLVVVNSGSMGIAIATGTVEAPGTRDWAAYLVGGEDLAIADDLAVTGDVTVGGTLAVTGNITHTGTLVQTGANTQTGAATLSSTLAVTGNVTHSGTLVQTGAVTHSDTLVQTGAATITGALTANSNCNIGNAAADLIGFYTGTGITQRAGSNQASTNLNSSTDFAATQTAIVQEIMATLTALGLWKGSA